MVSRLMGDSTALASAIVRCCPKNKIKEIFVVKRQFDEAGITELRSYCATLCQLFRFGYQQFIESL